MISVCGEAVVDFIEVPGPVAARCYVPRPGGSPLNVAIGLARLDVPASLFARIGAGRLGRLLRAHLAAAGVSDRDLVIGTEPCALAVVSLDPDGTATYDFFVEGAADWQWGPADLPGALGADVRALHVGSLATLRGPGADAIAAMVEREHARGQVTIGLDPNIRPALAGDQADAVRRIDRLATAADVIKASTEDLAWLYPGEPAAQVARRWHADAHRLVVVTDSANGAMAICPDGTELRTAAAPTSLVDTVGAGDSFAAALLAGLADADLLGTGGCDRLRGAGAEVFGPILDRAARAAAITCSRAGADPPTRLELDAGR